MKEVFSELAPAEIRGLETTLKRVGKHAEKLLEEKSTRT